MGSTSSSGSGGKTNLSPAEMVDMYNKALPVSLSNILNQAPSGVNTLTNAAVANNPIFTAGTLDQMNQYGGGYQQAGADLQARQANSQADYLTGAGANAAAAAEGLNRYVNRNYYGIMDPASQQATNLVNSVSMNGLSPGEQNAVERSLNQTKANTGNLGLNNATNTVSNAVNFGGAFNQKQGILGNALNTATNVAGGALNQGFNPIDVAHGAGNLQNNFGLQQFNPGQANQFVTTPVNTAIGFGSQLAGNTNATKSGSQSNGTGVMSGCCFIFLEMYHGDMPSFVRKCRDRYYTAVPEVATGYKKMAKWLVPLMSRSAIVRSAVWHLMVKPLTDYGSFVINRTDKKGKWARKFWFTVWKNL